METDVIDFCCDECSFDSDMKPFSDISPVPYPVFSLEPEVSSLSSFSGNSVANTTVDVNTVNTSGSASDLCTCCCRTVEIESMPGKCVRYAGSKAINAEERELSEFVDHPMTPIHSDRFDVEDITFASGECQRRCGRCNAEEDQQTDNGNGARSERFARGSCKCNNTENFNARICLALENLCALKKSDSKLLHGLTCQIGELQRQQSELYAVMSDKSKGSSDIPGILVESQNQNERCRLSKYKCELRKSEPTNCPRHYDGRVTKDNVKLKHPRCASDKMACTKRKKLPYERLPEKLKDRPNSRYKVVQCEKETTSRSSCAEHIPSFYEKLLKKAETFLQRHAEAMSQKSRSSLETTRSSNGHSTRETKSDGFSRSISPDEIDICERTVRSQGNDLIDAKTSYHLSDVISANAPLIGNLSLESRRYLQRYKIIPS